MKSAPGPNAKARLAMVYGQADCFSTSYQNSQFARALQLWFQISPRRVGPSAGPRWLVQWHRFWRNYLQPALVRPSESDYVFYGNDGWADLSRWRGRKIVYWYDAPADWSQTPPRPLQFAQWLRFQNVLRADFVFAVSRVQECVARKLRPGREQSVHYLPVGVDCDFFTPSPKAGLEFRVRHRLEEKLVVGYLGYLGWHNGRFAGQALIETAPAALRALPAHFLVVGFGPAFESFRQEAEKQGLTRHFTFTGFVPNASLPAALAAMDICVDTLEPGFHSKARSETKLKQYMAMGKACVATDIGENRVDLDGGECGLLASSEPNALAEGLVALGRSSDLRRMLGERARTRAEAVYDWRRLADRLWRAIHPETEADI